MVKQATSEGVAPAAPAPATRSSNPAVATGGAPKFPTVVKFIRIAQLVLGIVVLGLTAYLVSGFHDICYTDDYGYCYASVPVPGNIAFNVFTGLWAFLVNLYLIPAAFKPSIYNSVAAIVLDVLSMIFWFAGFIALAVFTGYYSDYTGDDFSAGFGILAAATAFAAISWALFLFTLITVILGFTAHSKSRSSATPMQQYPGQQQYAGQGVAQHA